jgi:hypothetical protein
MTSTPRTRGWSGWRATAAALLCALAGCEDFNPPAPEQAPGDTVADAGDGPLRDAAAPVDATVTPQDAGDAQSDDDGG